MSNTLSCECGREIPVPAFWKAMTLNKPLRCSRCGHEESRETLLPRIDSTASDVKLRAALVAWHQVHRYGWTSSGAISNAEPDLPPQVIGGILSGLARSGMLQRASQPTSIAADIADPRPVFVPGPLHPVAA